jgi:AmmeMemoRadiSam system protein A
MNDADKRTLLKLARDSIASRFDKADVSLPDKFRDKQGVFVTLHSDGNLRGCIGYAEPTFPLRIAVCDAAKYAAFDDPRFPPLVKSELQKIKIEISVLSVPKEQKEAPDGLLKKMKIGRDGLIIRHSFASGLLLPQVAVEHSLGKEEFLACLCQKAGLPDDAWRSARIYTFQAEVFSE